MKFLYDVSYGTFNKIESVILMIWKSALNALGLIEENYNLIFDEEIELEKYYSI